ncbi:subtilisin-like protease SBT4.15 isoform X1 [Nicotiana tomentosiformis]|uniref:subtilisin-like protease SBT4.15 isoform X1 n=1 Tax=Nicotiana tomentosiformis TaxID=4098 RepID=UPI00051B7FBC|nr:subtilisin-like protease SBT4.15 isoform X1 [Nicotiana tomentosiformis]
MKMWKSILIFIFNLCLIVKANNENERKSYIVYMGELPKDTSFLLDNHHNLLKQAFGDRGLARESRVLHSYGRSFNAFVARLLPGEADVLSRREDVISVFPNTIRQLRTTRSWDFLGMPKNVKRIPQVESDIIVGVIDTGIWIESPSFNDEGFGPPPSKWKGKCDKGVNFTKCNNKVIGAQYFNLENIAPTDRMTPADFDGHGTHTASTVAGISVPGASLYGLAKGTARGGVPSARIATYKACWEIGCTDSDILAAFDAAIADGVDVISLSVGGAARDFFDDTIAIGAFHALKKGILTSCAGGNDGPTLQTIENVAPWIFTVAASSIDRQFETDAMLGNGVQISGLSINTFEPTKKWFPLTSGSLAEAKNASDHGNSSSCDIGTLEESKVKGKIVYCLGSSGQDYTIKDLKGAGAIILADRMTDTAFSTVISATSINPKDASQIEKYIYSTKSPQAVIYKSRTVNVTAPFVTSFSSRGPQPISLNILKPDIAAPGLSILAAYSGLTTLTGNNEDNRVVKYNVESGTSMACPHAAAATAYVKSFHPDWSPAAIKSALMTTAKSMKIRPVGAELASGAGQINPRKAINPGLIYDLDFDSYISYFCKEGYNSTNIALLTGSKKYNCSSVPKAKGTDGLNYPSMHLQLNHANSSDISAVYYRTVTYVGRGKAVYKAKIRAPKGLSITVVPKILSFSQVNEKKSFRVILKGKFIRERSWFLSGSLVWSGKKPNVKSPILVYRPLFVNTY